MLLDLEWCRNIVEIYKGENYLGVVGIWFVCFVFGEKCLFFMVLGWLRLFRGSGMLEIVCRVYY